MNRPPEIDLVIIGGGPAGLAAAIASRAQGLEVLVVDCASPSIDKTCGEGLMPDSLTALEQLGIRIRPQDGFPFRGIRFWGDQANVASSFPRGAGIGIRRPLLHRMLVDRACEVGVQILWNTRVSGLTADSVLLDNAEIRCRWIVGADGQNSRVRRWAGLDACSHLSNRFGFRRHYRIAPWTGCMEIYWASGCQLYVTPVSSQEVCVVLISRDPHLRFSHVQSSFPRLMARLGSASQTTPEKGAVSASRRLKQVCRGNVCLAGDASGSVDAITGEGLCLSFRQAIQLAQSLHDNDLAAYQRWHRRSMRRPFLMANLMLSLDRFSTLRESALRALAAQPFVFSSLLSLHVNA